MQTYIKNLLSFSSSIMRALKLNLTIIDGSVQSFNMYIIRQSNFNLYREK